MQIKPTAFLKPSIRSVQYGMAESPATQIAPAAHAVLHCSLTWKLYCTAMPSNAEDKCRLWCGLCKESLAQESARHHAREGLMVIGCNVFPVLQQVVHGLHVEALLHLCEGRQEDVGPCDTQQNESPSCR